jgi:hypothetical protein
LVLGGIQEETMYDDEQTPAPTDEAEVEGHKFSSRREDGTDKPEEDVEGHQMHNRR